MNIHTETIILYYHLISGQDIITYKELKEFRKCVESTSSYHLLLYSEDIRDASLYFNKSMKFSLVDIKILNKNFLYPYIEPEIYNVFEKVIKDNIRKKKLVSLCK